MRLTSVEEILRFAIRKEADAATFYRMMAGRANPGVKKMFEELAAQEDGHRRKLEKFDLHKLGAMKIKRTKGHGLAERMEDVPHSPDMGYADLLRMAIKQEERSQLMYATTAEAVEEPKLKKLLLVLAQEESVHKERLEKMYDQDVMEWF